MYDAWSNATSWLETCQRSNGRRGYNKRRQLIAAVRRQVIVKHLRQAARRRHMTPSAFVRTALHQVLG
jgi:hypothetical protein